MKKILFIIPHLSTGGAPQFLVKKIQLIKDKFDIYVVEYNNLSNVYIVQKNIIRKLVDFKKFFTLGENKNEILNIIKDIDPDIIHFEEIPELYMDQSISNKIYTKDKKYLIYETTHTSTFNINYKRCFPDKFVFVSHYNSFKYNNFDIPNVTIEYPINDIKISKNDKETVMNKLDFDPLYKHVLNVGLFTSGKNQSYVFDISRRLLDQKIMFHFVGNQAVNFKQYWEPLMKNRPKNCVIWGEKDNIKDYYLSSDLFLFTSNKELNPLVVKESLEYKLPIFLFNLGVYHNKYDEEPLVNYLTGNLDIDTNNILLYLKGIKNRTVKNNNTIKSIIDIHYNNKRIYLKLNSLGKIEEEMDIEFINDKKILYSKRFKLSSEYFIWVELNDIERYKEIEMKFYKKNKSIIFTKKIEITI
jgi:hypothetical protein